MCFEIIPTGDSGGRGHPASAAADLLEGSGAEAARGRWTAPLDRSQGPAREVLPKHSFLSMSLTVGDVQPQRDNKLFYWLRL